jgi:hypothetical protein
MSPPGPDRARRLTARAGWIAAGSLLGAAVLGLIAPALVPEAPSPVGDVPTVEEMLALRAHFVDVWPITALIVLLTAVGVAALVPLTIGLRGVSTQPRWTPLPLTVSFGAGVVIVAGLVQVASLDLAGWLQVSEEAVRSLVVSYQLLTSSMSYVAYIGAFVAAVGLVVELRAAGDAVPRPVPYVALAGAALVGLLVLDVLAGTDIGGQWAYVLALGVVTPLTAGWTAWALGRARVSASQTG